MQGVYTVRRVTSAITAAENLIVLEGHADCAIEILRARVRNQDNDTNEQARIGIYRVTTAGVGAITALVEKKTEEGSATPLAVAGHTYATTQPVLETDPIDLTAEPMLAGYEYAPLPEERVYISPGADVVLRLDTAIASSVLVAQLTWREIGG